MQTLEVEAQKIAYQLDSTLLEFRGSLYGASDLTKRYLEIYEETVTKTCDSYDQMVSVYFIVYFARFTFCFASSKRSKL